MRKINVTMRAAVALAPDYIFLANVRRYARFVSVNE
jgi:hypothetical protein